jgi:hypothetical protein
VQLLGGLLRLRVAGFPHETLEPLQVELRGGEPDRVAGRERYDQLRAGAERLTKPRDARLEGTGLRLRGALRPELLDQSARRDDLVRVQQKEGEQAALPLPRQLQDATFLQAPPSARESGTPSASTPRLPPVSEL